MARRRLNGAPPNMVGGFTESECLQDILTCMVCFERLQKPKVLQCGHTFCKVCLEGILAHSGKKERKGKYIPCPVCTKPTLIPGSGVGKLPDNILIKQLLERTVSKGDQLDQEAYKSVKCSSCIVGKPPGTHAGKTVRFFCYNCSEYFCQPCKWKHEKSNRNHTSVLDLKFVTDSRQDFCQEHREHSAYYCMKCAKALCVRCISGPNGDHDNHNVVSTVDRPTIAKKNADLKRRLPVLEANLKEANRRTRLVQDVLQKYSGTYAALDSDLLHTHQKLKAHLKKWYEQMEQERVEKKKAFEKSLELIQDKLNQYTTSCQSLKTFVEHVLVGDNGIQTLAMYRDVIARMTTLEKSMVEIDGIDEVSVMKFTGGESGCLSSLDLPSCWEEEVLGISFGDSEANFSRGVTPNEGCFTPPGSPEPPSKHSTLLRTKSCKSMVTPVVDKRMNPVRRSASSRASLTMNSSELQEVQPPKESVIPVRITRANSMKVATELKKFVECQSSSDMEPADVSSSQDAAASQKPKRKDSFLKSLSVRVGLGKGSKKKARESKAEKPHPLSGSGAETHSSEKGDTVELSLSDYSTNL